MAYRVKQGEKVDAIAATLKLWDKQIMRIKKILTRYTYAQLLGLLTKAAQLDRITKGMEAGNVWDGFLELII